MPREVRRAIAAPMFRRPDYSARVLGALAKCQGIEKWSIVFRIDPWSSETTKELLYLCHHFRACPSRVITPSSRQGCNLNIKSTIDAAFEQADFVACIEDDIVVASDSLLYFEQFRQRYEGSPQVFTAGLWNHPSHPTSNNIRSAEPAPVFFCWGWATWRDRWSWLRRWIPDQCGGVVSQSWDCCVGRGLKVRTKDSKLQMLPLVSRAINIGATRGTHTRDHAPAVWAGDGKFESCTSFDFPQ